jgi:hypothetical protein
VIATGFERSGVPRRVIDKPLPEKHERMVDANVPSQSGSQSRDFQPQTFNTEDLDIPTFLRNRGH